MIIKKILLASLLVTTSFLAVPALSADLVCHIFVKAGGHAIGNGGPQCFGQDFSYSNETSGNWSIINITNSIDRIDWRKGCGSGLSCSVTIRAYSDHEAEAYIHYDDGSIEYVAASMRYETGF